MLKSLDRRGHAGAWQDWERNQAEGVAELQDALREIPEFVGDDDMETQIGQHLSRRARVPARTQPLILAVLASNVTKDCGGQSDRPTTQISNIYFD